MFRKQVSARVGLSTASQRVAAGGPYTYRDGPYTYPDGADVGPKWTRHFGSKMGLLRTEKIWNRCWRLPVGVEGPHHLRVPN